MELLGPLRLRVGDTEVAVHGTRRRALLAVLALEVDHVVGVDRVVDGLWDADPPASGHRAVASLASRLRRDIGDASAIEHAGGGYRVCRPAWQVDLHEVRAAHRAAQQQADPAAAAETLRRALGRWRGPALEEFSFLPSLRTRALTLHELRLTLEDDLLDARSRVESGTHLVEQTYEAMLAEPLRERRQLLHVRALASAGRAADALRTAASYRRRLAEETGLEPSAALSELEAAVAGGVLGNTPSGIASTTGPTSRLVGRAGPPRSLTPLLGREDALHDLERLVASERLVAVVGPGGVGKTRLVTEAAGALERDPALEVTFVALAQLEPPRQDTSNLVATALAGAIGLRPSPGQSALDATREWLGTGRHVLVLDNCEHLVDRVRDVVVALLSADADVRVVLTSRVTTGLAGEHVLRLGPLPPCTGARPGDLDAHPAVRLFVERARQRVGDYRPDHAALCTIADVVDRLDGLPLAIELAAARMSTLSIEDLARRLDGGLDLLRGGRTTADARHRSLAATLEWSHRLLTDDERRLLRYAAEFADGAELPAIETMADALELPGSGLNELGALVDASMVQLDRVDPPRYRMLETVRALVRGPRATSDGSGAIRALVRWARGAAEEIGELSRGPREPEADRRLRRELGNFRAAHRAAVESEDLDAAIAISVALDWPAAARDLPEIWSWAVALATRPGVPGHTHQVDVLGAAANAAWLSGDLDAGARFAERGLALDADAGRCAFALAGISMFRGDLHRARSLYLRAAATDRVAYSTAACAAAYSGDVDEAERLIAEGLPWAERTGSPTLLTAYHYAAGETRAPGAEATESYELAIRLARRAGAGFLEGVAEVGLASVRAAHGEVERPLRSYRRLVAYWARTGNWAQQWVTLDNLARLLDTIGDDDAAAALERSLAVARHVDDGVPGRRGSTTSRAAAMRTGLDAVAAHLDG